MAAELNSHAHQRLPRDVSKLRTTLDALQRSQSQLSERNLQNDRYKIGHCHGYEAMDSTTRSTIRSDTASSVIIKKANNPQQTDNESYRASCVAIGLPYKLQPVPRHDDGHDEWLSEPDETADIPPNWPLVDTRASDGPATGPTLEYDLASRDATDLWTIPEIVSPLLQDVRPRKQGHTKQSASCDSPTSFQRYFQSPRTPPQTPHLTKQRQTPQRDFPSFSRSFEQRVGDSQPGTSMSPGTNIKRFHSFNDRHGRTHKFWSHSRSLSKSKALRASMNKELPNPLAETPKQLDERPAPRRTNDIDVLLHDLRMANAAQCSAALFRMEFA